MPVTRESNIVNPSTRLSILNSSKSGNAVGGLKSDKRSDVQNERNNPPAPPSIASKTLSVSN